GYVRALLLIGSPLVAVLANVIRLVPTVWMFGHMSRASAEAFHSAAGWAMTVAAFLFLMGCVRLLQWAMTPDLEKAPSLVSQPGMPQVEIDEPVGQPA